MRKFILKSKSRFYINILKILGVCGVFIIFEACYGTPKSAWTPKRYQKPGNTKEVKAPVDIELTSVQKK